MPLVCLIAVTCLRSMVQCLLQAWNCKPSAIYRTDDKAPKREPSSAPISSTPKVCPVIGTGPIGIWIEICAVSAMNNEPTTTNAMSRNIACCGNTVCASVLLTLFPEVLLNICFAPNYFNILFRDL